MHKLKNKGDEFWFSLLDNSLLRVLQFDRFFSYFKTIPNGHSILDYGSGSKPYEKMFLRKFEKYIAVDYEITNAKHSIKPDIYVINDKVDISSNSIDCAVLTEVLEHLYEPREVLKEIHRILKPGGILIGTVPFFKSEHEQPYDFHRYTYFCLDKMFKEASFNIVQLDYIGDSIGVVISAVSSLFQLLIKVLKKIKLGFVAYIINLIFKLPEYAYFYLVKIGLNPQKIRHFKKSPLAFTFFLEKT